MRAASSPPPAPVPGDRGRLPCQPRTTGRALSSSPPRIGFVSLGCPKALVDSERILTRLRAEGYDVVATYEDAQLVVVNTCGFIDDAVHESLEAIGGRWLATARLS
jgi:ribosomal protein S12 methylthiotransferase